MTPGTQAPGAQAPDPRLRPFGPEALDSAAAALRAGGLVAFPTETVYGLGADATNDLAVADIFACKGRPRFNPLIVHFADIAILAQEVVVDARAGAALTRFCPGPLTLVLPRRDNSRISRLCSAGLPSLAVRLPAHPVARQLIAATGRPLAAPSANASGAVSPTTAAHVAASLDWPGLIILDAGPTEHGLESSIVDLTRPGPARLLRPGAIPRAELAALLGPLASAEAADQGAEAPSAPGQLANHYAPGRPLRLDAREVAPDEALIAFGPRPLEGAAETRNLSPAGDLREAAAQLFAILHDLDRAEFRAIAVMPIPETGLGEAINDRLRRAATPR